MQEEQQRPDKVVSIEESEKLIVEVVGMKVMLTGNLSLCHLKRQEIDEAEFYNGFCLDYDPQNVKAHFRKIQIHLARNELGAA